MKSVFTNCNHDQCRAVLLTSIRQVLPGRRAGSTAFPRACQIYSKQIHQHLLTIATRASCFLPASTSSIEIITIQCSACQVSGLMLCLHRKSMLEDDMLRDTATTDTHMVQNKDYWSITSQEHPDGNAAYQCHRRYCDNHCFGVRRLGKSAHYQDS
jgi:hypothetical protein